MRSVLIERKTGATFDSSSCSAEEIALFRSSFMTDEFMQKYGEPDIDFTPEYKIEYALGSRRQAYLIESDPLYMEWQFDKTAETELAWRDKVAEIKARYPLPVIS